MTRISHRYRRPSLIGLLVTLIGVVWVTTTHVSVGEINLPQPGYYPVDHDVDGDTIVVRIDGKKETVRLIGIDTPETHDPRVPVQCFGQAAAAQTQHLIEGQTVRLEADALSTDRDKYHRLLRYVYLPNGIFVNQALVQQGYAFAYVLFPNTKLDQFRSWEMEARSANRGLWAGCQVHSEGEKEQTQGL